MLISKGIKHLTVLNGGIQSAFIDAKEILTNKGRSTPLSYYKKIINEEKNI